MNAPDLLAALLDAGSFRSWDAAPAEPGDRDPAYAADLARARAATGADESVVSGEGLLGGRRVAVAASEFGFLGGSIGVAAGERLTAAVERATRERLPMIVLPASGGTRMQEGTVAFLQMVKITAAVTAHRSAGLPYLVYLRHPTTGGVFASWASLGHVTLAEPGALIGFLGPRVSSALVGRPFPGGVQTAENLRAHGLVDAIVPPTELGAYLDRVLTALTPGPARQEDASGPAPASAVSGPAPASAASAPAANPAWQSVLLTRAAGRPGAAELIRAAATDVVGLGEAGVILALARADGRPCVLVAQDRAAPPLRAAGLRLARRGMSLAEELRMPLVTVIDTAGAELSPQAEEQGVASEIAQCIALMINLRTLTVAVLLGQGTGGAALALLPADRVLAARHAWLAPLAPEGASAIVYKDTAHAAELAGRQGIRSVDLAGLGIVDRVVAETADLCLDLGRALHEELSSLAGQDDAARLADRLRRYRRLGLLGQPRNFGLLRGPRRAGDVLPHGGPASRLPGPAGRRVILVDSDVLIEHLRGAAAARDWLVQARQSSGPLAISVVSLAEIAGGMRPPERREVMRLLGSMQRFEVTGQVAWRAATLMQEYRRSPSGIGLGTT